MGKPEFKIDDELLQRYFDDALIDAERARVEAALTDEDRERLAALAEMRALLSGALDAAAGDVDLVPAIERGLRRPGRRRAWWRGAGARGFASFAAAAAALAVALFVTHPWRPPHPSNECDVEVLDVEGGLATVLRVSDPHHGEDATTTIIWTETEEE
jgi:anti-sigma factor RsiW